MDKTWNTQQNVVEAFEAGMAGIGLFDNTVNPSSEDDASSEFSSSEDNGTRRVTPGSLNQGHRIDHMLQEREIESANEYVAALAAHSHALAAPEDANARDRTLDRERRRRSGIEHDEDTLP